MSEKFFVGMDVTSFDQSGLYKPVSRVTLMLDDENVVTAGDDTGRELVASCPHATQSMVNAILAKVKGYQYTPFNAGAANLDPAAELGDGITVSGIYSVVARVEDDGEGYPSVSAPGEEEMEDEYPAPGPMTQEFNRKIGETRSLIKKTSTEILLQVENQVSGLNSSIQVELGKITQRVENAEGSIEVAVSTLDGLTVRDSGGVVKIKGGMVTADGLHVDAANINGLLTASQINAAGLKVDAANITGTLVIGQLPSTVAKKSDIPDRISALIDDSDFVDERGVTSIVEGTVTTDYVNALGIYARKLMGETVSLMTGRSTIGSIDIVDTSSGYGLSLNTVRGGIKLESGRGNIYLKASTGQFLQLGQDGLCQFGGGPFVVGGESYGSRLPSSGTYGQVFFLLE